MKVLDMDEATKLWEMLREKDRFTAEHCKRVAEMTKDFARELGWDEEGMKWLEIGALIHDLGKLDVPGEIFEKIRKGIRITPEEVQLVKQHAGHTKHLKDYDTIHPIIKNIKKYHHERFDGTGYPYGLEGDKIPEEVRIFSIADYYDSIMVQRSYKTPKDSTPLEKEDAIRILIEEATVRFDPEMVTGFINAIIKKQPIPIEEISGAGV